MKNFVYIFFAFFNSMEQSCPNLCDPMDLSQLSSVHGILQARILEWIWL